MTTLTTTTDRYYIIHIGMASNADLTYIRDNAGQPWTLDAARAYADEQQLTDVRTGAYRVMADHGHYREDRVVYTSGGAQPAPAKPTRKHRMTDDEKRARREAKKQSNLTILGRATFKATGAVLFGIEDRNDKQPVIMHMTLIAGKVTGCHNATTGEECDGRHWSGHCCHETRVLAYEAQRQHELATAEQVAPLVVGDAFNSDLNAHVEDEMAAPADPWTDESYDPFAGMTKEQKREAYRDLYPDDFAA